MAIPENIWVERIPLDPHKEGAGSKVGLAMLPRWQDSHKRLVYFGERSRDGVVLGQVLQDGRTPER